MDDNRPATGKYAKPGFKRRRALDDGSPARRAQVSDTADRPRSKKRAAKDAIDPRRNQFRVHAIEEQPVVVHDGPERPGFERRMTKDEINRLPLKKNEQAIIFVQSEDQLSQALAYLKNERILGFDTETKPAFTKGERYLPSLVQLSGKEKTIIIQVAKVGFPMELRELLSNASIIKAGVGVDGDIRELQEVARFSPAGFEDLSEMAKKAGIQNIGLRGMAAVLLGFRISKGQQRSNWGREDLSEAQLNYAALDSWACREIYIQLNELLVGPDSPP